MARDLRHGVRLLRRNPGLTLVAVLSLGLGIGATTAVFSLIDAIVLRTLPVVEPERVYSIFPAGKNGGGALSYPGFMVLRQLSQDFAEVFTYTSVDPWNVSIDGRPELTDGILVTDNYFDALGVKPSAGRLFSGGRAEPEVVISHGYWKTKFGLSPQAVGSTITVNRTPLAIVGVTAPDFHGAEVGASPRLFVPMALQPLINQGESLLADRYTWWLGAMARLKPGVDEARARAGLDLILPAVRETMGVAPAGSPDFFSRLEIRSAANGESRLRATFGEPLWILMATLSLVLLVACANVASLLLTRATARRHELAIRMALGGRRTRVVGQLFTESLLLALLGGIVGVLFARWVVSALFPLLAAGQQAIEIDLPLDLRTLGFAALVAAATAILFGVVPALRATRIDPGSALKEGRRTAPATRQTASRTLVVSQVAVSLVLVATAGLFFRTLDNLRNKDLGFEPDHLLLATVEPTLAGYRGTELLSLYERALDRLGSLPGVRSASLSRFGFVGAGFGGRMVSVPGFEGEGEGERDVAYNAVGPRFFATAGIRVLVGRDFTISDSASSNPVAIVNQRFARFYFGKQNPVGKRFVLHGTPSPLQIVGVVADTKFFRLRQESPRTVFVPFQQTRGVGLDRMVVQLRTEGDPIGVAGDLLAALRAMAPEMPVHNVRTQRAQIETALARERLLAAVSGFFSLFAALLAAVGLYGVLSYKVVRRTVEIGVRTALGARPRDVVGMMVRDTVGLAALGISVGIALFAASSRLVQSQLFGVEPVDPAALIFACASLVFASALAGAFPAWRAARIDPISALRHE